MKAFLETRSHFMKLATMLFMVLALVGVISGRTLAQTFEPFQNLSADPGFSDNPQIAVSGTNVAVVWLNGPINSSGDVFFRYSLDSGVHWGPVQNLSARSNDSNYPHVAVSGSNVFVTWEEVDPETGSWEVYIRRSSNGGATFDPPVNLSAGVGSLSNPAFGEPDIVVLGTNVYVVWGHVVNSRLLVFFRRSTDAGITWSEISQVSPSFGDNVAPRVIAVETNVIVAWRRNLGFPNPPDILARNSSDGGMTWDVEQNLSSGGPSPGAGIFDITGDGSHVFIVWDVWEAGNQSVFFRRSTNGGTTFELTQDLSGALTTDGLLIFPRVAASGQNVYVTWNSGHSGDQQIFLRRSLNGGITWDVVQSLSSPGVSAPAPVAAEGTNIFVIWRGRQAVSMFDAFFRSSHDSGATWNPSLTSDPLDVSGTGKAYFFPRHAVGSGVAFVVWRDDSPGTPDIFFRRAVESFKWPLDSPIITQDYACYNCAKARYPFHTGIDAQSLDFDPWAFKTPVKATAEGEIVGVYRTPDYKTTWCDGSKDYFDDISTENRGFGNAVILNHSGVYSLYGHLDCIDREIVERFLGIGGKEAHVSQGKILGNMGRSCKHSRQNCQWPPHLHFELKDKGVLGDPKSETYFGYTPLPPDRFAYHDPMLFLHPEAQSMASTAVITTNQVDVHPGPGLYGLVLNTLTPGTKIVTFRQAANDSGAWYQVHIAVPRYNPEGEDNVIEGWIAEDLVEVDNATKVRVKDGISEPVDVYLNPGRQRIALVWSKQEFVVAFTAPAHQRCQSTWYNIFLGKLKQGWICGDAVEEVP